jgi:hypothetical protein
LYRTVFHGSGCLGAVKGHLALVAAILPHAKCAVPAFL